MNSPQNVISPTAIQFAATRARVTETRQKLRGSSEARRTSRMWPFKVDFAADRRSPSRSHCLDWIHVLAPHGRLEDPPLRSSSRTSGYRGNESSGRKSIASTWTFCGRGLQSSLVAGIRNWVLDRDLLNWSREYEKSISQCSPTFYSAFNLFINE